MATCVHGFDPGQCLICQTLNPSAATGGRSRRRSATAERAPLAPGRETVRGGPVEVVDHGGRSGPKRATSHVLLAVVVIIVAILAFWLVAGVVFALLRLIEILVVALAAGMIGYRLGRARGHRDHRDHRDH